MVDLKNFDLNLLIVFEAVYSTGNVSHAAKQLNQTQPTVSNALSRLRDLLDDALFVRTGRGVEPTSKAQELIGPVREALHMIKGSVSDSGGFDPAQTKRAFRLVMLDHLEALIMPGILSQIQDHRSVTIESVPIASVDMAEGINNGSLDLVLATFLSPLPEIECESIGTVDLTVISRKNHPKINGTLDVDTFSSLGHVALPRNLRQMSRIDEYLFHHKIERHVVYTVLKMWSFPNVVANSELLAILPRDFATVASKAFSLDLHELPFEVPLQECYMSWKKKWTEDPGHRWLRETIKQACYKTGS